mmetsp:Transcript_25034/g.83549  ORF Transcript_25034/g.83549 Transcript_25034/m.83549 type:complete len:223 (+) Transcript_25034:1-669(+)
MSRAQHTTATSTWLDKLRSTVACRLFVTCRASRGDGEVGGLDACSCRHACFCCCSQRCSLRWQTSRRRCFRAMRPSCGWCAMAPSSRSLRDVGRLPRMRPSGGLEPRPWRHQSPPRSSPATHAMMPRPWRRSSRTSLRSRLWMQVSASMLSLRLWRLHGNVSSKSACRPIFGAAMCMPRRNGKVGLVAKNSGACLLWACPHRRVAARRRWLNSSWLFGPLMV